MLSVQIDVSKIDKTRLFEGTKGTYLNFVLIETPNSEYNDYVAIESISKEERDAGNKGTIIGNGKIIVKGGGQPQENKVAEAGNDDFKGDLPF